MGKASTILVAAILATSCGGLAHAQTATPYRVLQANGHVHANGRCHGVSYGTGYHSCGSATGGPAGGLPSRN